jgi:hypothetical protein
VLVSYTQLLIKMFYALMYMCVCITREHPTFVERLKSSILRPSRPILQPLNACQCRAVLKVLTANDYILIKGMPGTGEHQNVKQSLYGHITSLEGSRRSRLSDLTAVTI